LRTSEEPRPPRWRRRGLPKRRVISAAVTVAAGLLLAAGLSVAPAGAAVTSTGQTSAPAVQPQTLSSCLTGENNTYLYKVWCTGSGPTSYRSIAYCADGDVVFGPEFHDGADTWSIASCESNGLDSTLGPNWGILLCSNDNGDGTYQGYYDRHGDISQYFQNWGSGNIATGGTWACEYDTSGTPVVSPTEPEISSAGTRLTASS
jgi:hypothetical protein